MLDAAALRKNEAYTHEYLGTIAELGGDEIGRRDTWEVMWRGSAFYHGLPVALSYVPRMFGPETRRYFADIAEMTYGILSKVITQYLQDPAYRAEFRFDPRVEELILLPSGYDEPLPVTRVDFMFDEMTGDFHFCEFNTDSSSGMNEAREALRGIADSEPFLRFTENHTVEDDMEQQFEGWVRTFKRIYESSTRRVDEPRVAIVACLDSPNPHIGELEAYMQCFEAAGMPCSVFDVRQLSFDGEKLIGGQALAGESNVEIDVIWRFCIVVDLLEHWDDVQPFIEALRQQKVEMIGSFATQVAHDKQLFAVLRRPATQAFLTPAEREFVDAHIPRTMFLDDPTLDLDEVKRNPARWVLKPTDWYASINVEAGAGCTPEQWAQLIDECAGQEGASPFIVQEFFKPCKTLAVPIYGYVNDFTADPKPFGNLLGAYVYAGEFAGIYVRQGPYDVIGSARAGLVTPVLWVDCEASPDES